MLLASWLDLFRKRVDGLGPPPQQPAEITSVRSSSLEVSSYGILGRLLRVPNILSIIRRKSTVAEREPGSDASIDINMSATNPPPHKRKLSQPDVNPPVEIKKQKLVESNTNTLPSDTATKGKDAVKDRDVSGDDLKPPKKSTTKKIKPTVSTKSGTPGATSTGKPSNASEEFPNGHLYCHQCNKKRDATRESHLPPIYLDPDGLLAYHDSSEVISCTEVGKKCKTKYCKPCLGNRYGEDIDEIKKTPPSGRGKTKMPYTFKCVPLVQLDFPRL
jgi:hypothetical protein